MYAEDNFLQGVVKSLTDTSVTLVGVTNLVTREPVEGVFTIDFADIHAAAMVHTDELKAVMYAA